MNRVENIIQQNLLNAGIAPTSDRVRDIAFDAMVSMVDRLGEQVEFLTREVADLKTAAPKPSVDTEEARTERAMDDGPNYEENGE